MDLDLLVNEGYTHVHIKKQISVSFALKNGIFKSKSGDDDYVALDKIDMNNALIKHLLDRGHIELYKYDKTVKVKAEQATKSVGVDDKIKKDLTTNPKEALNAVLKNKKK